jgi:hypothetical protein
MKGLNAGRSFVTTGPMLLVQVESQFPGHQFQQPANTKEEYRVTGTVLSGRPLQRIEIIVNGEIAQTRKPKNQRTDKGAYESPLDALVSVDSSSWIAVRCFEDRADKRVRFAHSAPFHIEVAQAPLRPRKAEIDFLVKRVEDQLKRNQGVLPAASLAEYEEALRVYRKIAMTVR